MPFFPKALHFETFLLGHAQKSKFGESDLGLKGFFNFLVCLSFFSFSNLFAAVIDHVLGLLPVEKCLRKHHRDGQFLPWST